MVGAHAHEVPLVAHHVDQLELLEEGGDGREALAHLRPRLDRDAQRRRVVEDETQERVPDEPLAPVRDIEIEAGQMRQRHLALFVVHREIVPGAVLEIADSRDAHPVAVDERPRHHRDLRSPLTIVRGRYGYPPRDDAEKQHDQGHGHAPLRRHPESPDRERRKGDRQPESQASPRQVRVVDGKGSPHDEHDPAQKPDRRRSASQGRRAESRDASSVALPFVSIAERLH